MLVEVNIKHYILDYWAEDLRSTWKSSLGWSPPQFFFASLAIVDHLAAPDVYPSNEILQMQYKF